MAEPKLSGGEARRLEIDSALRTLEAEASGISALAAAIRDGLGAPLIAAVEMIQRAKGRLIVTGMG
jgi:arabinose-5-phosphate isomerase